MFHATILKKPALILVSENDLIGPPSSNSVLRANWEREDVKVTYQCWQDSRHAAHFMKHPNEYLELLYKHLEDSGVLSSVGVKKRAKLWKGGLPMHQRLEKKCKSVFRVFFLFFYYKKSRINVMTLHYVFLLDSKILYSIHNYIMVYENKTKVFGRTH